MRILLYTQAFAPKVGGQESIVMLQACGLAVRHGVQLTLATPTPADGMDDSKLPFRVVRQPNRARLCRLVREADVLHLAGPLLLLMVMGLVLRKPVFVEHHGFQTICPNGQLLYEPDRSPCPGHFMARRHRRCIRCNTAYGKLHSTRMWLLTFVRRWVCQRVSVNILPTNWLGTLLQLNSMKTIVHGLPPLEPESRARVAPPVPTFAYVGRLVSTKGVRVLLEAASILHSKSIAFRVRIIGQGPDRESLEQLTRELQIQHAVSFLGYLPPDDLSSALSDVTAIVMPSLAGEVFGMVAAQNMQQGRLVVASDVGALREVVGDAGLVVPVGNVPALAQCLEQICSNPTIAAELGRRASRRIHESFSADQMITEHLRAYLQFSGC